MCVGCVRVRRRVAVVIEAVPLREEFVHQDEGIRCKTSLNAGVFLGFCLSVCLLVSPPRPVSC